MTLQKIVKREPRIRGLLDEAKDFMLGKPCENDRYVFWYGRWPNIGMKQIMSKYIGWDRTLIRTGRVRRGPGGSIDAKDLMRVKIYRDPALEDEMLCSCEAYDIVYDAFIKLLKI